MSSLLSTTSVLSLAIIIAASIMLGLGQAGGAGLMTTMFLHRYGTHRTVRVSKPMHIAGQFLAWFLVPINWAIWVLMHRKHHLFADRQARAHGWIFHDPHSPRRDMLDFYRTRYGFDTTKNDFVGHNMRKLFHAAKQTPDIKAGLYWLPSDRRDDSLLDRYLFRFAWLGAVFTGIFDVVVLSVVARLLLGADVLIAVLLLGLMGGLLAIFIHIKVLLRFGGIINDDHHRAERLHPVAAYANNTKRFAKWIFGEGSHFNHHLHMFAYRFNTKDDFGAWVLERLARVRLVRILSEDELRSVKGEWNVMAQRVMALAEDHSLNTRQIIEKMSRPLSLVSAA